MKRNNAVGPQIRDGRPKAGKLIPLLGVMSLVAGLWGATQFFAHTFAYHPSLGGHLNQVYPPWSILWWAMDWYSRYPKEITQAGSVGVLVAGVGLVGVFIAKQLASHSSKPNDYLHGSARWADKKDIQTAGLLKQKRTLWEVITNKPASFFGGVYVGGWQDKNGNYHYLRHDGPEHILCYAPTRSGKGVCLVIPTLLSWAHSCVITDIKGELWALTSGWRQKYAKNKVLRFEPAGDDEGAVCWNPLAEIRMGTKHEVGDVQNLCNLIVDPDGKGLEDHWQKTAWSLLVGVVLYTLYQDGERATLPRVDAILADPNRDIKKFWKEMKDYNHPVVGAAGRDMCDRPDDEAGSVLSSVKSYLSLYRDPVVAKSVGHSDFRIKQLMNEDSPVSLYIVTHPNDKARLKPLVRIMVNMIVRLLADKMDFKDGRPVAHFKHRLLMMMDEFPSLGKLEIMQESLAFVAGYGIKCYLICQDINQLKSPETGYGHDESITSNCHVQNAFPPNRPDTADYLSRLTGQTTIVKEQITTSGRRTSAMLGQVSRTFQEVQRPLLTPDECLRMPGPKKTKINGQEEITESGDMVVYVSGFPAIYGKQMLYFKDPIFQKRAAIPAPKLSDRLTNTQAGGDVRISLASVKQIENKGGNDVRISLDSVKQIENKGENDVHISLEN